MAISKKRFLALALSVIVGGSVVAAWNTDTEVESAAVPASTTVTVPVARVVDTVKAFLDSAN